MKNSATPRQVVQGAVLLGIYIFLILIMLYVPILGFIAFISLSVPFIYYTIKHGLKQGLILAGVTLLGSLLILPLPLGLITVMAGSVGLVMGSFYRQQGSPFYPVLAGSLTYLANFVLVVMFGYFALNINAFDLFREGLESQLALADIDRLVSPAVGNGDEWLESTIQNITLLLPGWLMLISGVTAFFNHFLIRLLSRLTDLEIQPLAPLWDWNLPKAILYYYLVVLLLLLFNLVQADSTWYMPVLNIHFVLEILLLIQGFSLVAYLLHKKGVSRKMNGLLLTLLAGFLVVPFVASLVRIAGIIDLGFNLKEQLNHALRS